MKRQDLLSKAHHAAYGDVVMDPRETAAVRRVLDLAMYVQAKAVGRFLEIVERHRQEWIRPSEGAERVVVAAHACVLIADEIRREFGLEAEDAKA